MYQLKRPRCSNSNTKTSRPKSKQTISNTTPNVGDVVTFTITVNNAGPDAATGVAIEDAIPNGYSNITAISNAGAIANDTINWTNLSIANGGSITLTYTAKVNAPGVGVSYTNTAQVTDADQLTLTVHQITMYQQKTTKTQ